MRSQNRHERAVLSAFSGPFMSVQRRTLSWLAVSEGVVSAKGRQLLLAGVLIPGAAIAGGTYDQARVIDAADPETVSYTVPREVCQDSRSRPAGGSPSAGYSAARRGDGRTARKQLSRQ
jgi:hypothetical protein